MGAPRTHSAIATNAEKKRSPKKRKTGIGDGVQGRPPVERDKVDAYGLPAVLQWLIEGNTLISLSREIGVDSSVLGQWIRMDEGRVRDVEQARILGAEGCDERGLQALKELRPDATKGEIAQAMELAKHWRWRAEKRDPRQYGTRTNIDLSPTFESMSDQALNREIVGILGIKVAALLGVVKPQEDEE